MDPSKHNNGASTQSQNSGTITQTRGGPSISHEQKCQRHYLNDLITSACEYLLENRPASLKANDLLHGSFPPNPLRVPKISRFPKISIPKGVPKVPLPKKVPPPVVIGSVGGVAGGSGVLALLYQLVDKFGEKLFKSCHCYGKVLLVGLIAYAALRVLQYLRNRGLAVLNEQIPERVSLILCDEILAHDESRMTLLEILENPRFFAIIPKCVMDGILFGMESTNVIKSSKAYSAYLVISDLVRLRKAEVEGAPVLENHENLELGWESSEEEREIVPGYEDRIVDCAQNERLRNLNTPAFIITYSREIRTRAVRRGLRCNIPPVILNWSRD